MLLTGASGFMGAAILSRPKQDGHAVVAVARSSTSAIRRLPADAFVTLDVSRGVSAFAAVLAIFWLMIARPEFSLR